MLVPRVTLGIATYNRATYLAQAICSGLRQEGVDHEVLVVADGSTNHEVEAVLSGLAGEPRLRVVRHAVNRGIAAAYNTIVREARGELIAMLGDDDLCLPGRLRREAAIFDRFPDTGIVHGDATVIDGDGLQTGAWNSGELSAGRLLRTLWLSHNPIVDPTRMVHRSVYDAVGDYDDRYPIANDMDFWHRAAAAGVRFRHCAGGPVTAVRRHGENASDARAGRDAERADVLALLRAALDTLDLRAVVPELDWPVINPILARQQALERLADGVERRAIPLPELAAELRERAAALLAPAAVRRPGPRRTLMMTSFGFADPGGGTTVPRLVAKELVRRGWDVTVFHAATRPTGTGIPYEVRESTEDGVRLIGVHNRPHGLFDIGHPDRELDDPQITAAFAAALDRTVPDVVHFHNLHNLGAALIGVAAARCLPAFFTTHNYWLICPRAYLLTGDGAICPGPGDGTPCAECTGGHDTIGHARRLAEIRARAQTGLTRILAVSDAVRAALLGAGYGPELVDVVRQAMPHDTEIWDMVGSRRAHGRPAGRPLTVAFLGSAYPHKGPQLLVDAAQRTQAEVRVRIVGEVPERFAADLRARDTRGVVEISGPFSPAEIGGLLADVDAAVLPSLWWDCAPLAAAECRAAGLPLVVPRLGGLPETVVDGVDGLLFDPLDPDDLARALDRLAGEPGLLERLGAAIPPPASFGAYVDALEGYYAGAPAAPARPSAPAPAVRWQGDWGRATSLSIINDRVTELLPGPVVRVPAGGSGPPAGTLRALPHPADVEVRHQWPPDLSPARSGSLAAILPWEFGSVPARWLAQIEQNVDEVWTPSEYVRAMYIAGGIAPERVVAIPNGVDLDLFAPGPRQRAAGDGATAPRRFLFVGGLIFRKAPDVLLAAWTAAFAGRTDVTLVVKDFGADGVYRGGDRDAIRAHAQSAALPRIELVDATLDAASLAELYRSCDVLVHPYRAEGFAMPVLEAMASGLPVITTGGGPTDEFCPPDAGWRIRSSKVELSPAVLDAQGMSTDGAAWVLQPDTGDLVTLLRTAADATDQELHRRGAAGRAAAQAYSWQAVSERYAARIAALAGRGPARGADGRPTRQAPAPLALPQTAELRVLATPPLASESQADPALVELLRRWAAATDRGTDACLYLLADPATAGSVQEIERLIVAAAAAAGADLDACADVDVLIEPFTARRDRALHAATNVYVPVGPSCAGHIRLARTAGNTIVPLQSLGPQQLTGEARRLTCASPT